MEEVFKIEVLGTTNHRFDKPEIIEFEAYEFEAPKRAIEEIKSFCENHGIDIIQDGLIFNIWKQVPHTPEFLESLIEDYQQ